MRVIIASRSSDECIEEIIDIVQQHVYLIILTERSSTEHLSRNGRAMRENKDEQEHLN